MHTLYKCTVCSVPAYKNIIYFALCKCTHSLNAHFWIFSLWSRQRALRESSLYFDWQRTMESFQVLSSVACCCCPDLALFSLFGVSSLLDCKDILGKFVLVGGRFVDENHEFCSMGGVEEVAAEWSQWITTISETMES